jgi:prolyl-tRNA synthetase
VNFYQIHTKFRDEIRPRFGVMRAREFIMKDAYSFHLDEADAAVTYQAMYEAYTRIFTRLGLKFRAVAADSGAIGGSSSHEFHVLADSGEDAIAFSDGSDYAANLEMAEALAPSTPRAAAAEAMNKVVTPYQRTCEMVAELLKIPLERTVKSVALMGEKGFVLALVRGDHAVHELKLSKLPDLSEFRMATEAEILEHLGTEPGFIGPVFVGDSAEERRNKVTIVADRTVAAMADFVVGANEKGFHLAGVNWGRDLPEPALVADIRSIVAGDPSPDGKGTLSIARGIEVGHVFNLGKKYAEAMKATVLDAEGKARIMHMGCYGVGVSRIVAAAIEQNSDANGILWPEPMAPWRVAVCIVNPKNAPGVVEAAEALYEKLLAQGIEACLDDRGLRPGPMLADIELIGIPHRVVVSERGLAANTYEYRARRESENRHLSEAELFALFS